MPDTVTVLATVAVFALIAGLLIGVGLVLHHLERR